MPVIHITGYAYGLRSPVELGVIARNYHKITGHTILKAIDNWGIK